MIEIIGTPLYQWDTGRFVKVTDIEADHVHFANKGDSKAPIMDIVNSEAEIPDYLLQTGKQLCVYAVKDGITVERKIFSVIARERPENYVYDEDQRNFIYALITDAQVATEEAKQAGINALLAENQARSAANRANTAASNASESADKANEATDRANEAALKAANTAKSLMVVGKTEGANIALDDAIVMPLVGLRVFGKTTQDGTPTPDAPVNLVSVGDSGSITVNVTGENDAKSMTIATPNGLPGIPVKSGGNYTDANGQQWVCNEIDFHNAKHTSSVKKVVLGANFTWTMGGDIHQTENTTLFYCVVSDKKKGNDNFICDRFQVRGVINAAYDFPGICGNPDYPLIYVRMAGVYTLDEFIEWIAENPITIVYQVAKPIETPLSEEELAAYASLHTYRGNTTVSNDASAHMELEYVMDAKKYIDSLMTGTIIPATVE